MRPLLALAALSLAACGYVGDPLPPLANIPGRIADLAAIQRGPRIIVQFTVPQRTTEDVAIRDPLRLDLRISGPVAPFAEPAWEAAAKRIAPATPHNGLARYEIPADPWTGQQITIAARTIASNGKPSAWSNFVTVPVAPPPVTPTDVKAEATAAGVRVTWSGPPGSFRVLRRAADDKEFSVAAPEVNALEWLDASTEFGKSYRYIVQRMAKPAESDLSAEVSVTPVDVFPPAPPEGLRALASPASVELSWNPNSETDVAGYRVYRASGQGAFAKLADISLVPSYSDRAVEAGKTYRYAVTAVDRAGNESAHSVAAEASVQ